MLTSASALQGGHPHARGPPAHRRRPAPSHAPAEGRQAWRPVPSKPPATSSRQAQDRVPRTGLPQRGSSPPGPSQTLPPTPLPQSGRPAQIAPQESLLLGQGLPRSPPGAPQDSILRKVPSCTTARHGPRAAAHHRTQRRVPGHRLPWGSSTLPRTGPASEPPSAEQLPHVSLRAAAGLRHSRADPGQCRVPPQPWAWTVPSAEMLKPLPGWPEPHHPPAAGLLAQASS